MEIFTVYILNEKYEPIKNPTLWYILTEEDRGIKSSVCKGQQLK